MESVLIAKFVDQNGVVSDRTFTNCEIAGPAELIPLGTDNVVTDCQFAFTPDTLAAARVRGGPAVLLVACTFQNCLFAQDIDAYRLQ